MTKQIKIETTALVAVTLIAGFFLKDIVKFNSILFPLLLAIASYFIFKKNQYNTTFLAISISLIYVMFIYLIFPKIYYDDTGFVIRYFQNFWEGHWFKFNVSDDPVFGLSGFLYGLVGGTLCYLKFLRPEDAIDTLCVVGIFFTSFLMFKIQLKIFKRIDLALIFWVLCMFGNSYFLNASNKGLETPFHTAIVLSTIYFFLAKKGSWMWLFMGLSVASKLDAVPTVVALGIAYLTQVLTDDKPLDRFINFLQNEFIYAVAVMSVYLVVTFLLFGSPMPHSGATKLAYHQNGSSFWFPFLEPLIDHGSYTFLLVGFLVLFSVSIVTVHLVEKKDRAISLVFGFAFIGTMILYYIYNPYERMMWYYPLPIFLLLLQISVSTFFISNSVFKHRSYIACLLAFVIFGGSMFSFVVSDNKYWLQSIKTTEFQRMQIGYDLATKAHETDTIASYHGLPICRTKAYVLDMTGLNSELATEEKLDEGNLLSKFKPHWYETHLGDQTIATLNHQGKYGIDLQYYSFVKYAYPPITVFKRDNFANYTFSKINLNNVANVKVVEPCGSFNIYISPRLELVSLPFKKSSTLFFGNDRFGTDYYLIVEEYSGDKKVYESRTYVHPLNKNIPSETVMPIAHQIHSDSVTSVVLKADIDWISVHISTPILQNVDY